jgi:DNA-binding CsgD family transcriptional regulator
LSLAGASDPDGAMHVIGTLRQTAPRAVALLRALSSCDAPAREIELVRLLDEGLPLVKAAEHMRIAQSSAETLRDSLNERFGVNVRGALIEAMVAAGLTAKI